jgi:hypothetical protein
MPRGIGWKRPELEFLLHLIEQRLPVGGEEWAKVAELHVKEYPDNQRDKDSIKRKYSKLYLAKMPTGDPSCPWSVRRAKAINEQIKRKCDITEGNSDAESEQDDDDEDYEDAKSNEDDVAVEGEPAAAIPAVAVVPNVATVSMCFFIVPIVPILILTIVLYLCIGLQCFFFAPWEPWATRAFANVP